MKILAIETSATACSVALCEDEKLICTAFQKTELTHSRTLMPMIENMLENSELSIDKVDFIAVAAGPGSFTGLRIGVSTAKAIAWARNLPCAPCSTLKSMAWQLAHMENTVIICAMDARRDQVYSAAFLATGDSLVRLWKDGAMSLEEVFEKLRDETRPKIIVGDGAQLCYNYLLEKGIACTVAPPHLQNQMAWGVAREGLFLAKEDCLSTAEQLSPVYHRLSQAERERQAKLAQAMANEI